MKANFLLWLKSVQKYIYGVLVVLMLFLVTFVGGCVHGKKVKKCPEIISGTIIVTDTVDHYIYNIWPWYIQGEDTTIYVDVPANVDTVAILHNYFNKHIFDRKWENDTLLVNLKDTISQNKPIGNIFRYKIKTPFTTINNSIDNSIIYQKYVFLGAAMPVYPFKANTISNINYIKINGIYTFPKGFFELSWQPYTNIIELGTGVKILQLKK